MNDARSLGVMWFNTTKGTVGIVKVITEYGDIEYRISAVDGFMEKMDVQQVIAWGAKFPDAAGEAIFGAKHE